MFSLLGFIFYFTIGVIWIARDNYKDKKKLEEWERRYPEPYDTGRQYIIFREYKYFRRHQDGTPIPKDITREGEFAWLTLQQLKKEGLNDSPFARVHIRLSEYDENGRHYTNPNSKLYKGNTN